VRIARTGGSPRSSPRSDSPCSASICPAPATNEILRRADAATGLCLIGGRLGAALAVRAAERREDVRALVLWDPVLSGLDYLEEIGEEHRRVLATAHVTERAADDGGMREILGFALPGALQRGLEELDATPPAAPRDVLRVDTASIPGSAAPWAWMEDVARAVLPVRAIHRIAAWISEKCP
jgi:pimeloyl-ACP methyl ester carboxylesterase